MTDAINIIRREHRAIAAVVHCLDYIVKEVAEGELAPDFEVLHAIVAYIEDFPDRYHHPKEDDYLFKALAKRSPGSRKAIHDLKQEHELGERKILEMRWKLEEWEKAPKDADKAAAFTEAARDYIAFQRRHIGTEEGKIIPEAREVLTEDDWAQINAAFNDNEDPIFGDHPRAAFDRLFAKIVSLAPEPVGLAPRKTPDAAEDGKKRQSTAEVIKRLGLRRELLKMNWI